MSSCQVVKLSSLIPWDSGQAEKFFVSMSMLKPNRLLFKAKITMFFFTPYPVSLEFIELVPR